MNDNQLQILFASWLLSREGKGQVACDHCIPDCHKLAEAGWLERRIEDNGDMSWHWTQQAEVALRTGALITDAKDRQN